LASSCRASAEKNAPERTNLSRTAFARSPTLSVGYISQLERGTKQPKGPALALLNVIRRKGFEGIL
jgi:putative transcriptional regulator